MAVTETKAIRFLGCSGPARDGPPFELARHVHTRASVGPTDSNMVHRFRGCLEVYEYSCLLRPIFCTPLQFLFLSSKKRGAGCKNKCESCVHQLLGCHIYSPPSPPDTSVTLDSGEERVLLELLWFSNACNAANAEAGVLLSGRKGPTSAPLHLVNFSASPLACPFTACLGRGGSRRNTRESIGP